METIPGTKKIIKAELVLIALGFVHPVLDGMISELELDQRKNIKVNENYKTNKQKVFAAGDCITGASLVVNAIASGRAAAEKIDMFLKNE